jgi:hypothetical protein
MTEIEARVNITHQGQNGDLPDTVPFHATDDQIKGWATEAVVSGIPGIAPDSRADFSDFVVDRFAATEELPARICVRPKTPFGTV